MVPHGSVRLATVLIPYSQWIGLALAREQVELVARLCSTRFTAPNGTQYYLVADSQLVWPDAFGENALHAWRRVVPAWDRWEWLIEFFGNKAQYERCIDLANFTMWLYARRMKLEPRPYAYFMRNQVSANHVEALIIRLGAGTDFSTRYLKLILSGNLNDLQNQWQDIKSELNDYDRRHLSGKINISLD